MAVTLKDTVGRLGSIGSVVTVDARLDQFGARAHSLDDFLDQAVQAVIGEHDDQGWPTWIPDPVRAIANDLVDRFGLTIVADTTPEPDQERPSSVDDRVIY